jgi:5-methylcytosine-specific restriction endonuclease McrA
VKRCKKCGEEKALSEFYESRKRKTRDGLMYQCKDCTKQHARENRSFYASQPQQDPSAGEKECYGCKQTKLLVHFPSKRGTKDGYAIYCKRCEVARVVAYQQSHPAMIKRYAQTPVYKAKKAVIDNRRRARKEGAAINDFTRKEWEAMNAHYGQRCVYCGKKSQRLQQDHITLLSKGGNHTASNIVPACRSCNVRKGDRVVPVPVQPVLLLAM